MNNNLLNETSQVDGVPDMAGQSPFDKNGMPIELNRKAGVMDYFILPIESGHNKSGYHYFAVVMDLYKGSGGNITYVKAPTTMNRDYLNRKISDFLRYEYKYMGPWSIEGMITPSEAVNKSQWMPSDAIANNPVSSRLSGADRRRIARDAARARGEDPRKISKDLYKKSGVKSKPEKDASGKYPFIRSYATKQVKDLVKDVDDNAPVNRPRLPL